MQKGDLILLTDYKDIVYKTVFKTIGDLFTHVAMYQGNNKIIHANSLGVHMNTLHYVAKMYDAYVIIRPNVKGFERAAIKYAKSQLHLPYDLPVVTHNIRSAQLANKAYKCGVTHALVQYTSLQNHAKKRSHGHWAHRAATGRMLKETSRGMPQSQLNTARTQI